MDPTSRYHRRRGQTLVEFAIVLPILLIMVFGIIEFGRVFQAWVSLQNSARAAARFASTGNVNYDIFDAAAGAPTAGPKDILVLNDVVPCSSNTDGGTDVVPNPAPHSSGMTTYGGSDGLFATWYGGLDCEPTDEDHVQLRKDILRLVSIMYEARESVNALSVESRDADRHYYESLSAGEVEALLYEVWLNPMPRESNREWFNVMICSNRGLIDSRSAQELSNPADPNSPMVDLRVLNQSYRNFRFITVRTPSDAGSGVTPQYPMPFCMLNEVPHPDSSAVNNAGTRWLDAGGPGDTVTIGITFNHPLITPLRTGVENYLQMQARRSIVNESFRAPKAVGVFQRTLPPGNSGRPGAQETATETATTEPTATETATPQPTATSTNTPEPFMCEKVTIAFRAPAFEANQLLMDINNGNLEQIELKRVTFSFPRLASPHEKMFIGSMAMGGLVHWSGTQQNTVFTANTTSLDTGDLTEGYRFVPAQSPGVWSAVFFSGPSQLTEEIVYLGSVSTQFTFVATPPGQAQVTCIITQTVPPEGYPTPQPTATLPVNPSPTPNCVQSKDLVVMEFGGFTEGGGVYFNLANNSGRDLILQGFKFYWPDRNHPRINGEPSTGYHLARVLVGGDSVTGNGQRVWQGNVTQGNTSPDRATLNNPTFGGAVMNQGTPVGSWLGNATLPAGVTRIWLDFNGFSVSMESYGAIGQHFDQSKLYFACRSTGGSGGSGSSSDGDISVNIPTPLPTNTLAPSRTPGPTRTPAPATPIRTATNTRTPLPATLTFTPPPVTFTPSRTPFGVSTPPPAGGGE